MSLFDSMSDPRTVMVSPFREVAASPYSASRPGTFASPGEVAITASGRKRGISTRAATPQLLRTAKDVRGAVDIMVFNIQGFADNADVMGKTDPYVRVTYERQKVQTKVKNNAGGTVEFNEKLSISKSKDKHMIKVSVCDSDYLRDDVLAEKEIDLSKLPIQDWSEFIEQAKPIPFDLEDRNGRHAGTVFLGFAACTVLIKIYHIENFVAQSGFMDKTDPYVKITYGGKSHKTKTASNAGGNANFDEIIEFQRSRESDLLTIQVFDDDTTSDDCLGERQIDLTKQYFSETLDGTKWVQAVMLDLIKDGRLEGSVKLAFCKVPYISPAGNMEQVLSPVPKVKTSFAGQMHVKVFKIEGFSDSAGPMDKSDPYVSITVGKSTQKTNVKSNAGGSAEFNEVLTFPKDKDTVALRVSVRDSDALSRDDVLGSREIDLTRQVYAEDLETVRRGIPFDFISEEGAVIGRVYLAFSACIIHCHVHSIEGFASTSGFMDKTDPYVRLQLGTVIKKTKVKNNAGGAAQFKETLSMDKPAGVNMLKVSVCDSDTTSDDVLGERDVDLRMQYYWPTADAGQATAIEVYRGGKIAGTVHLSFAKSPKRPGSQQKSPQRALGSQTKWVPERVQKQVARPVVYRKQEPCEELCECCCCCCLPASQPVAVPPATYPQGFREIGYRVDLDGQWERRDLAGDETHVLSIEEGADMPLKARVEVPVQYQISVPGPAKVVTDVFVEREVQRTVMTPMTVGTRNAVVPGPQQALALPAPPQFASSPLPAEYMTQSAANYPASPQMSTPSRGPPALINSMAHQAPGGPFLSGVSY